MSDWLETLLYLYGARVLPIELPGRGASASWHRAQGQGRAPGLADLEIAATAQQHGYTILTRNSRHFDPLEAPALDPFAALPTDVT